MKIEFEEEVEPAGDGAGSGRQEPGFTPGPWMKWRLAPDSDVSQRLIVVTEDGETEICGIVSNEADADLLVAAPALYEAVAALLDAMEIQEGRENEELHVSQPTARHVWSEAKSKARAALALVDGPQKGE